MQKDLTNVCASDRKGFDRGIIGEKLESMKKSRSGFLSNVTRLQGKLDVLLQDVSKYEEASKKRALYTRLLQSAWNFVKGIFPRCHAPKITRRKGKKPKQSLPTCNVENL